MEHKIMSKLWNCKKLAQHLDALRMGKMVVFTNGCFDILHAGHVDYLKKARDFGDLLVVGINSDHSVRTIKGIQRPIIPQKQRAEVLCALECINYVVIFDQPDPLETIKTLKPDVLVKGADWALDQIIGAEFVMARAGKIERIAITPEISTSKIIEIVLDRYS